MRKHVGRHSNFARVEQFLRGDDLNFTPLTESALEIRHAGDNGTWSIFILTDENGLVTADSIFDERVPTDRRAEFAELIARANEGGLLGNFNLDFDDGRIRYHSMIDVADGELVPTMISNLVYGNMTTADQFFKAIMAVCDSSMSAKEAYSSVGAG